MVSRCTCARVRSPACSALRLCQRRYWLTRGRTFCCVSLLASRRGGCRRLAGPTGSKVRIRRVLENISVYPMSLCLFQYFWPCFRVSLFLYLPFPRLLRQRWLLKLLRRCTSQLLPSITLPDPSCEFCASRPRSSPPSHHRLSSRLAFALLAPLLPQCGASGRPGEAG